MAVQYWREVLFRFQAVLALLQLTIGAYLLWHTTAEGLGFLPLGLALTTVSGGMLALAGILRLGPLVTATGGLMGFAAGHPGYLLVPLLLIMFVAAERLLFALITNRNH